MARWPSASSYPGTPEAYPATPKAYPETLSAFPEGSSPVAPTNVPSLSLLDENDTARALMSDANSIVASVTVDDGDGSTTTGVNIYDSGDVLVGAAADQGGGVWEYTIGTKSAGTTGETYGYYAERVTANGNIDSDPASVLVHNFETVFASSALLACNWGEVGWTPDSGSGITWADQAGTPHDFTSLTGATAPVRSQDATINNRHKLAFNGTSTRCTNSHVPDPPGTTPWWIAYVIKQNGWTSGRNIESGGATAELVAFQSATTPNLRQSCGTAVNESNGLALSTWGLAEFYFSNSTSDYVRAGDGAAVTGSNAGNTTPTTGRKLGCNFSTTAFTSMDLAARVVLNRKPTDEEWADFYLLLDAHYNDAIEHGVAPVNDTTKIIISSISYDGMVNTRAFRTPFATTADGTLRYCIGYNTSRIVVGKRTVSGGGWVLTTGASFVNVQSDAHNVGTIELDGTGRLWASWGMHGHPLKMWWGDSVGDTYIDVNKAEGGFVLEANELSVTYPGFTPCRDATDDLYFDYRGEGGSGNGNWFLIRCLAATQTGEDVHSPLLDGVSVGLSPYPTEPIVDSDGTMYFAWCKRRTTDIITNANLYFAMSPTGDPAGTWLNKDGTPLTMPIVVNDTAALIDTIPEESGMTNVFGSALDEASGKFFVSTYADLDDDGVSDYYVWVIELSTGVVTRYDEIAGLTTAFVVSGGMTDTPLTAPILLISGGNLHVVYRCDELGNGYHDTWAPIANLGASQTPTWTNTALYTTDDIDQSMPAIDWSQFALNGAVKIWHQASHYTPTGGTNAYELTVTLPT